MRQLLIRQAVDTLVRGGVIAYPTEAVWGLGCDPGNAEACAALLQIKQRPAEKGMILIAGHIDQFADLLAPLTISQQQILARGWQQQVHNGATTFLVPDLLDQVPWWVKGQHSAVALRVSRHPLVQALCEMFGGPLVSTSANISGMPAARSRLAVSKHLGHALNFILPGELGGENQPSRIVDLVSGKTLRAS